MASSLPQPNSYLARDSERVLTDKHDVPGDLEMGDLGRESQQLHNHQERRVQPVHCCNSCCAVASLDHRLLPNTADRLQNHLQIPSCCWV